MNLFHLDESYLTWPLKPGCRWFIALSKVTNAYHLWRVDDLTRMFSSEYQFFFSCLIFLFGWLFWKGWRALPSGVITLVCFGALFSNDVVIFGAFEWLPFLIGGFQHLRRSTSCIGSAFLTPLILYQMSCAANHLAFIFIPLAWITAGFEEKENVLAKRTLIFLAIISCLTLWISLHSTPYLPTPHYPPLSQVVEDDGIPGQIRPLIGQDSLIPFIDRKALSTAYSLTAWLLLVICSSSFVIRRSRISALASVISFAVLLDLTLPQEYAQIAPLQSLSRIVPGTFVIALPPLAVALSIFLITTQGTFFPFLALLTIFTRFEVPSLPTTTSDEEQKWIHSPSLSLVRNMGVETTRRYRSARTLPRSYIPLETTVAASSNVQKDTIAALSDSNLSTRWSPETGHQDEAQWISFRFPEPLLIDGLQLPPGDFITDFPRALRVKCTSQCETASESGNSDSDTIFTSNPWLGILRFSPDGYPYYGSQGKVRAIFSKTRTCQCLRIEQTGFESRFNWSIAELRILREDSTFTPSDKEDDD